MMQNLSSMQLVNVNKDDLLAAIKDNRGNHRALFIEAQQEYRKEAIAQLDKMLEDARAGRYFERFVSLPEPEDHTSDYDAAIRMIEMSVDDVLQITAMEFQQYVMDNWGWKDAWLSNTLAYTSASPQ